MHVRDFDFRVLYLPDTALLHACFKYYVICGYKDTGFFVVFFTIACGTNYWLQILGMRNDITIQNVDPATRFFGNDSISSIQTTGLF